jgi:hypothetical protein
MGTDGTLVGVNNKKYESQLFYRSADGVRWQASSGYTGSHPIQFIAFGQAPPGTSCP